MQLDAILALLESHLEPPRSLDRRKPSLEKLYDFAHGDQYKNGAYWSGRKPENEQYDEIDKLYTQDDQIGPALNRVVSGILGRDPEWSGKIEGVEPERDDRNRPVKDPRVKKLEGILTPWHHDAHLQKAVQRALYLMEAMGRSCLREYTPDSYAADTEDELGVTVASDVDQADTLEAGLELTHLQAVDARHGGAIRDEHGREVGYYYCYTKTIGERPVSHVELHTPEWIYQYRREGNELTPVLEMGERLGLQYRRPNPLYDPSRKRKPRYMMLELNRDEPLVTRDVIDKQSRLNVSWTYLARNDDLFGFPSVYTINADTTELDEDGNERPANLWVHGPAINRNLVGHVKEYNDKGEPIAYETPSIEVIYAADPAKGFAMVEGYKDAIAEAFNLVWLRQQYKAVSGESKREDKSAWHQMLLGESVHVVGAIVWALETALVHAAKLSEQDISEFADISFVPKLYLDIPRGDIALFTALLPAYKDNLVSLDVLLESNPVVSDVQEEKDRLLERQATNPPTPPKPEPKQETA